MWRHNHSKLSDGSRNTYMQAITGPESAFDALHSQLILRIFAAMNGLGGGGRQNWVCPRARETPGTSLVGRSLAEEYAWNAISSFSLRGVSNPTPILFPTIRKSFRKPRRGHPTSLFVFGERTVLVLEVIASILHCFLAQMSSILVFSSERVTTKVSDLDEFLLLLNRLFGHLVLIMIFSFNLVFGINLRNWVLYRITYDRNSAAL